jgi:hypothetical protein
VQGLTSSEGVLRYGLNVHHLKTPQSIVQGGKYNPTECATVQNIRMYSAKRACVVADSPREAAWRQLSTMLEGVDRKGWDQRVNRSARGRTREEVGEKEMSDSR